MPTTPPLLGLSEAGSSVLLAASGPGVARAIAEAELIGWLFAGISMAIAAYGWHRLRHRSFAYRFLWLVAPVALHPRLWLDAVHGDAGLRLCFWSLFGTFLYAGLVALAILCQAPEAYVSRERKWRRIGALAGCLAGLSIAGWMLELGAFFIADYVLAAMVVAGAMLFGTFIGQACVQLRAWGENRFQFRLRTLLLLPIVVTPLFIILLPVRPYEGAIPCTFRFVVVDDATGRPIPDAIVRLINQTIPPEHDDLQPEAVMTGADGSAECFVYVDTRGREGLLGRTQRVTFQPWMIRVEVPGYRLLFTSLAGDPPVRADRLTDPPLKLVYPPPAVTIRLSRKASAAGSTEDQGKPSRLAP